MNNLLYKKAGNTGLEPIPEILEIPMLTNYTNCLLQLNYKHYQVMRPMDSNQG